MDVANTLKRCNPTSYELCIICQECNSQALLTASDQGKNKILEASNERQKLIDNKYYDAINRIIGISSKIHTLTLTWHKSCYSSFTSQTKISQLKQRLTQKTDEAPNVEIKQLPDLRSSVQPVDWKQCMFCQQSESKRKLVSIKTVKVSTIILEAAAYSPNIKRRVATVDDLLAVNAKYHLSCYITFL